MVVCWLVGEGGMNILIHALCVVTIFGCYFDGSRTEYIRFDDVFFGKLSGFGVIARVRVGLLIVFRFDVVNENLFFFFGVELH